MHNIERGHECTVMSPPASQTAANHPTMEGGREKGVEVLQEGNTTGLGLCVCVCVCVRARRPIVSNHAQIARFYN